MSRTDSHQPILKKYVLFEISPRNILISINIIPLGLCDLGEQQVKKQCQLRRVEFFPKVVNSHFHFLFVSDKLSVRLISSVNCRRPTQCFVLFFPYELMHAPLHKIFILLFFLFYQFLRTQKLLIILQLKQCIISINYMTCLMFI